MDAFIYFSEELPCGLDELEDALDAALRTHGEVCGSGTGAVGSNIDLFIQEVIWSKEEAVRLIRQALAEFLIPSKSTVMIDGTRFSLDDL